MALIVELREMSSEELENLLEEARERLFNIRFMKAQGSLEDTISLRKTRREIAQLSEVLRKRAWAVEEALADAGVSEALDGREDWSAKANFVYEEGTWSVDFVSDNGQRIASAQVDLNKKRRRTRRQRSKIAPVQKVVGVEVA